MKGGEQTKLADTLNEKRDSFGIDDANEFRRRKIVFQEFDTVHTIIVGAFPIGISAEGVMHFATAVERKSQMIVPGAKPIDLFLV